MARGYSGAYMTSNRLNNTECVWYGRKVFVSFCEDLMQHLRYQFLTFLFVCDSQSENSRHISNITHTNISKAPFPIRYNIM